MELRELAGELTADQKEIILLEAEVEAQMEAVLWLDEAVSDMEVAQLLVNSPRLESAMRAVYQAHAVTEERVADLRGQRDEMSRHNNALMDRCQESIKRKQEAQRKLKLLMRPKLNRTTGQTKRSETNRTETKTARDAMEAGTHPVHDYYSRVADDLEEDIKRTLEAVNELQISRDRLDAINL